jgi:hypothetical protein
MTDHEPHRHSDPDDPLDQLLRAGEWPEPDREAVHRLRLQWRTLRQPAGRVSRRRRLVTGLAAAAAAMIALAVCIGWWLNSQPAEPDRRIAPVEQHSAPPEVESPAVVHAGPPPAPRLTGSRPATLYEQMVFRSVERRRRARPVEPSPSTLEDPPIDRVDSAIGALIANPDGERTSLVESLKEDRERHELQLIARLPSASVAEQRAIVWLLSQIGSPRSVPALLDLSSSAEMHAFAVQALTILADDVTLARLVRDEAEPALQRELAGKLLARSSPQSVALYLDLLSLPSTRPSAVAVLDELSHPPLDVLFAFLNSPDASRQLQAAFVLGRLDGPQITQRLIQQVQWHVNRQEALVALLASSGTEARQFVTSARSDQSLFAAVNSAEFELQRAFP